MNFDTIVIGGGLAGYSAALRSLELGRKTAVISHGQSALHFSSGSIDVLAKLPNGCDVDKPQQGVKSLAQLAPHHPYSKLGNDNIWPALEWYKTIMASLEIPLTHQDDGSNHLRITPLGTLKSTWLSQPFVYQMPTDLDCPELSKVTFVGIDGFRDFHPELAADNFRRYAAFERLTISSARVTVPGFEQLKRNPCELRSIDIARLLRCDDALKAFADQLLRIAAPSDLVVMPAIMGNGDGLIWLNKLRDLTGLRIHEVPTMPPSLLGIRLEEAMSRAFIRQGGVHLRGDQVISGEFKYSGQTAQLDKIYTRNLQDHALQAKRFILATGSFFSQGLHASHQLITEPVFGLDLAPYQQRENWHQHNFFTDQSHPFLEMGVVTNHRLNPSIKQHTVKNLFCAGAILAHYNPISEGSGGGVAICTGFHAANQALASTEHVHTDHHVQSEAPL